MRGLKLTFMDRLVGESVGLDSAERLVKSDDVIDVEAVDFAGRD